MSSDLDKTISIRIAIYIPVGLAAETLAQIEPLVSRLSSSQSQKPLSAPPALEQSNQEIEEEKRKAERDAEYAKRLREFHSKKIQAYRTFRRIRGDCEKPYDAYRIIASEIGWSPSLIPRVISDRRKEIKRYIHERRKRVAVSMAFKGKTNKQIATRLGVCTRTKLRATILELEEQLSLLTASHKAMILAVGEIGGMDAWKRFFDQYLNSVDRLPMPIQSDGE